MYTDYQKIDDTISNLESFVHSNGFNHDLYVDIAIQIYRKISKNNPQDIPSRMHIGKILEEKNKLQEAHVEYKYIIDNIIDQNYQTLNSLGHICARRAKEEYKSLSPAELTVLTTDAVRYFKLAEQFAPTKNKAYIMCTLAWFQYRTLLDFDAAHATYLHVIDDLKDNLFSAYCGMAMLCANFRRSSNWFSETETIKFFNLAMGMHKKKSVRSLSAIVPYGNFLYCLGKYEKAREKYISALKLKPNETNAIKILQRISDELKMFEDLRNHTHIKIFDLFSAQNITYRDFNVWLDDESRLDIFSLLLKWIENENGTSENAKYAKNIIKNLRNSEYRKTRSILRFRIEQSCQKKLLLLNIGAEYASMNYRAMCFLLQKQL